MKSVSCRSTLGARGFSCAVSGFGQVLKKLTPSCGRRSSQATAGVNPSKSLANGQKSKHKPKNKGQACNVSFLSNTRYITFCTCQNSQSYFCTRNKAILTLESKIMQLLHSPSLFWFSFPFTYSVPSQGIFSFSVVTLLELHGTSHLES